MRIFKRNVPSCISYTIPLVCNYPNRLPCGMWTVVVVVSSFSGEFPPVPPVPQLPPTLAESRLWGYSRELVEWRVKCRLDECAMREYLNSALMWYLDRVLSWCHYRVVLWCVQGRCSVIELACKSSFANWQKIACQLAD